MSHDIIIGLVDLIGPFYDLFADSVLTSRQLLITNDLGTNLTEATTAIEKLRLRHNHNDILQATQKLQECSANYLERKNMMCKSANTHIHLLALEDGTVTDILAHPRLGHVFADDRVETQYSMLSALLSSPDPGDIIKPWSKPIDSLASEELNTPDPTNFPDDILAYLTTTPEEARAIYDSDLITHVTADIRTACPARCLRSTHVERS